MNAKFFVLESGISCFIVNDFATKERYDATKCLLGTYLDGRFIAGSTPVRCTRQGDVMPIPDSRGGKKAGTAGKSNKRKAHFTVRIGDRICENLALGDTLPKALEREPLGPTMKMFWKWLEEFPAFKEKFERAMMMQANAHADRIQVMAEEVLTRPSAAPAYRVAADILKWCAEIRDPKKYGQKVVHELKAPPLKPADLRAEIARLEAELGVSATTMTEPNPQDPAPPAAPNRATEINPDVTGWSQ